jgi:N-acetylmuramoyl-L-alanine amidase
MPSVYISPSTQDHNMTVLGNSEEDQMQKLGRIIAERLQAYGVTVFRNDPNMELAQVIVHSNSCNPDLHLALHSNAGGGTGTETWVYKTGTNSERFGRLLQDKVVAVLGLKDRGLKDATLPGQRKGEVIRTNATAVLIELYFHDNPGDQQRFNERHDEVVEAIVSAVLDWFGVARKAPAPWLPDEIKIVAGNKVIKAVVMEDRAYAPVRELAEALGFNVEWVEKTRTAILKED